MQDFFPKLYVTRYVDDTCELNVLVCHEIFTAPRTRTITVHEMTLVLTGNHILCDGSMSQTY